MERFLISVCLSGGKHADVQQRHVTEFLDDLCQGQPPVQVIRRIRGEGGHYQLLAMLQKHHIGRYTLASRMLRDLAESRDVLCMDRDSLCRLNGFAMKSASLFKMYQDPDARVAVLDRCTLRWLGAEEPATHEEYLHTERVYLDRVHEENEHPAIRSFQLWFDDKPEDVRRACEQSITDARLFIRAHTKVTI